jgi:hypothetical protein
MDIFHHGVCFFLLFRASSNQQQGSCRRRDDVPHGGYFLHQLLKASTILMFMEAYHLESLTTALEFAENSSVVRCCHHYVPDVRNVPAKSRKKNGGVDFILRVNDFEIQWTDFAPLIGAVSLKHVFGQVQMVLPFSSQLFVRGCSARWSTAHTQC